VENGATQQKPHFSFEGEICMYSSGCIMAVTISFAFNRECWVTQSNTNATFLKSLVLLTKIGTVSSLQELHVIS
jgi:uncharacterized Fe-S cluster protein YjdI